MEKMKKGDWIIDARCYLDEPIMGHLHTASLKTEDVEEIKELLKRAETLMRTYVADAEMLLQLI